MTAAPQQPWISPLAKCYVALTFALILVGGMVTTSGAGMAFETWPLSDGSVNPPGWTQHMLRCWRISPIFSRVCRDLRRFQDCEKTIVFMRLTT